MRESLFCSGLHKMSFLPHFGILLVALFSIFRFPLAHADEKHLRSVMQSKLGNSVEIEAINKTPYGSKAVGGGIYEVYMNNRLHYTDENFTFMIVGTLIDTKTNDNYSERQLRKHQAIDLSLMPPLKNAIKTNEGNGKKTMYIFSDPLCKHCQDLEKYLSDYPDVTTYVYLAPNDQVNPGATRMAKALWCSSQPRIAYIDYMRRGIIPKPSTEATCETPFRANNMASEAIKVNGTPGIVFGDGFRISGTPNPNQLKALIAQTPR